MGRGNKKRREQEKAKKLLKKTGQQLQGEVSLLCLFHQKEIRTSNVNQCC